MSSNPQIERKASATPQDISLHESMMRSVWGQWTRGISPSSLIRAYADWVMHLSGSPAKQLELWQEAFYKYGRMSRFIALSAANPSGAWEDSSVQDRRFSHPGWQAFPYNVISQSFLLTQQWWWNATTGVKGVSGQHEHLVGFTMRQILDMMSPSNFFLTNPEVLENTGRSAGANLGRGAFNAWQDLGRWMTSRSHPGISQFTVGENIAVTPGKVIYRNRLIELIQYSPQTEKVLADPVVVVPSWIMKYYLLDLSPQNSFAKYLVQQGHTVFMISWKNPGSADRELALNDYLTEGVFDAFDAVGRILPGQPIHGVGYCLGGTMLSVAAAAMARDQDQRLKSITLLASQTDFSEPGELGIFIDESQIGFIEDLMRAQGYLEGKQLSDTFDLLNSKDMIWSKLVQEYLMGTREPLTDLMAWNADGPRMPYKMHSEYLRHLYLNNELAEGRYEVNAKPVNLADIRIPMFVVATENDHVSPWHSVYKILGLTDSPVQFLLTSGGHNVGIVNPPPGERWTYRAAIHAPGDDFLEPEKWLGHIPIQKGSWWPHWETWLTKQSGKKVDPPEIGSVERSLPALADAPGTYVFEG